MKILRTGENRTILISLIIGIFLICIQSFIQKIPDFIFNFINLGGETLSNYVIRLVAEGKTDRSSEFAVFLILLVFLAAFIFKVIPMYGRVKSIRNLYKKKLSMFDESGNKIHNNIEEEENESPASDLEMFRQLKDNLKETNRLKWKVVLMMIITAAYLLYLNFSGAISSVVDGYNARFKNEVTVLSLYLDDLEIKQLRANWVRMKTFKDYREVKNQIDAYYKKFDIKN